MKITYDAEEDIIRVWSGKKVACASSLQSDFGTAVYMGDPDGHDVMGFEILGATAYLPLGPGYDANSDTLVIGETTDDPDLVTENGDFIGYWEMVVLERDEFRAPIGVALRRASVHLSTVLSAFPQPSEIIER